MTSEINYMLNAKRGFKIFSYCTSGKNVMTELSFRDTTGGATQGWVVRTLNVAYDSQPHLTQNVFSYWSQIV